MVTFSRIRYSEAVDNRQWQDKVRFGRKWPQGYNLIIVLLPPLPPHLNSQVLSDFLKVGFITTLAGVGAAAAILYKKHMTR